MGFQWEIVPGSVSVGRLQWNRAAVKVLPRGFSALTYRVQGGGTLLAGPKRYGLPTGSVVYLPAGTAYETRCDDTDLYRIHFRERSPGPIRVYASAPGARRLFEAILQSGQGRRASDEYRTLGLTYQLLALLSELDGVGGDSPAFEQALALLESGFRRADLRIGEVCLEAGLCETTFRKLFHRRFGKTPVEYLTELRLEQARTLLLRRSVSVEQAATECGFSDAKYLARTVKKYYGCTPTQLRSGHD